MARNTLEYTSGGRICLVLSSNKILIAQKISRTVWHLVAYCWNLKEENSNLF